MFRLAAIWTEIGCRKSEMQAEFLMENPKWFLKRERERACLQDNNKYYLMGVAWK
jgi:hypothetical protein